MNEAQFDMKDHNMKEGPQHIICGAERKPTLIKEGTKSSCY